MTKFPGESDLARHFGMRMEEDAGEFVRISMEIQEFMREPKGFVHGGCTLALLETVASYASQEIANKQGLLSFGVVVDVRHQKPLESGIVYGTAQLERVEGTKYYWHVEAIDNVGDVVSLGTVMTKIVSRERLEEKEREREAARNASA